METAVLPIGTTPLPIGERHYTQLASSGKLNVRFGESFGHLLSEEDARSAPGARFLQVLGKKVQESSTGGGVCIRGARASGGRWSWSGGRGEFLSRRRVLGGLSRFCGAVRLRSRVVVGSVSGSCV